MKDPEQIDFSKIVEDYLTDNDFFNFAYELIRKNSNQGKIFLAGGNVYRPIIKHLYGVDLKEAIDYDFLVENNVDDPGKIILPDGWELGYTHLGNYKFVNKSLNQRIDYLPMSQFVLKTDLPKVNSFSIEQKINSYLNHVPLSLQSIVYDIETHQVIGPVAIQSILDKKVFVNCEEQCLEYIGMYNMTKKDYMHKKYAGLGFDSVLD